MPTITERDVITLINKFSNIKDTDILFDYILNHYPYLVQVLQNKTISGCTINNDVTGDLTGDVTGDVTGDIEGSVTIPSGSTFTKETDDLTVVTAPNKTLVLSQPVWDDVRFGVDSVRLDGSKPPVWTSYKGGQALATAYTLEAAVPGELLTIRNVAAGTNDHTVTIGNATVDGANNILTFNAQYESITLLGTATDTYTVIGNDGVALSS